jgi:hypothetical protein
MAEPPRDATSGAASSSAKTSGKVVDKSGEFATGLISAVGNMLEATVHAVGNIGVTTMMEATRVLSTTAVGIRQTLGSVMSGDAPDFAETERKEQEFRQSR